MSCSSEHVDGAANVDVNGCSSQQLPPACAADVVAVAAAAAAGVGTTADTADSAADPPVSDCKCKDEK